MTPLDWYSKLLAAREISATKSVHLYKLQIKESELDHLQEILTENNRISPYWDACFVLYATEWWRCHFKGGHWSWEDITSTLGISDLSSQERTALVDRGFKKWHIDISFNDRGRNFLGTVVKQSGLPVQLLQKDHYIGEIVTNVYKELGSISSSETEYIDCVRSLSAQKLPTTLQNEAFYQLLLDFVIQLVNLKESHSLANKENPLQYLNEVCPEWRENFPIRIDQDGAAKFLDQLLSEVVEAQSPQPYSIQTCHQLKEEDGVWCCQAFLKVRGGHHDITLLGISEDEFNPLPRKVEVVLDDGHIERKIGYAFKFQEKKSLRIDGLEEYPLTNQPENISLCLSDPSSGKRIKLETAYENVLSFHEPLIFTRKNEKWLLLATGTTNIDTEECLVVINTSTHIQSGELSQLGYLPTGRPVFKATSDCEFFDEENLFRIRFTKGDELSLRYEFHPSSARAINFCRRENKNIYLGLPRVYQIHGENGFASRVNKGLEYRNKGQWHKLSSDQYGRLKIRLIKNGETHVCRTIEVLPPMLEVDFTNTHEVLLKHIGLMGITVRSDVESDVEVRGEIVRSICFTGNLNQVEERSFKLSLRNPELQNEISLAIPYPREEVRFYGKDQKKLPHGARLFLNELHGIRLNINNLSARSSSYSLNLTLIDRFEKKIATKKWPFTVSAYGNESISLVTLQPIFNRLFSVTDDIDARIELSYANHKVNIRQFVARPRFKENKWMTLPTDRLELDKIHPKALQLDKDFKSQNVVNLEFDEKEGFWLVPEEKGIWLVFPSEDSETSFRPDVFKNLEAPPENEEPRSIAQMSYEDRMANFRVLANQLAEDFGNPEWIRLHELYQETKHLPLATMDIWKAFVQEPKCVIAAALYFSDEFVSKLTEEFSIIWQLFPISLWIEVGENYFNYTRSNLPDSLAENLINRKLDELETSLDLSAIRMILEKGSGFEQVSQQQLSFLIEHHFKGTEGYPGLQARHQDSKWRSFLHEEIISRFIKLPKEVRHTLSRNIFPPYQPVTYLPFVMAAASVAPEMVDLPAFDASDRFRIQEMIEFDEDWFKQIYDLVQGYLYTNQQVTK